MHTLIYIYLKLQQNIALLILFVVNEQVQTDLEQIFTASLTGQQNLKGQSVYYTIIRLQTQTAS